MSRKPQKFILFGVGFVAERHLKVIKDLGHELIGALDTHDSVGVLDRYFPKCAFFTEPERMESVTLLCCKISREMFSDRSSESTTPRMKRRYSGISSLQSVMMKTRLM